MAADATAVSAPDVVKLFKSVYGDVHDLQPDDQRLAKDIAWDDAKKVGEKFVEALVLSAEVGITLGGSGSEAFEINPAIAGAVKQTEVSPYVSVLPSIVPWAVISRSAGGGEKAFFDGTKHVVKNNLKSHQKFQEMMRFYGQSDGGLGYVSYANSVTYRGATMTNGACTLAYKGTSKSFATGGIVAADKLILFHPGTFAAGHWVGMKGMRVAQVATATGVVVGQGKLVGVDAANGIIEVDFTPTAATSATSHKMVIVGMESTGEMLGIQKILSTRGSLYGINNNQYELLQGGRATITGKLTFAKLNLAIADLVNVGGLEGDLDAYVNPRTWATLTSDQDTAQQGGKDYKPSEAQQGFEDIVFYSQTGKVTVKAHRLVKEGEAYCLHLPDWCRSGSAEISFKVPGMKEDLIFPLENQAGYAFRSFSDQYVFCYAPCRSLLIDGINDESTT